MNKYSIVAWFAAVLSLTHPLEAQVPSTLNYQGRIAVSGVNFTGTGQFKFALVNGAGSQSYWSNDGTSTNGGQPTAAVSLTVSSGLYNVLLGDTSLTNMTAVPATVFANADVRLRVWFNDGTNGFQQMTPDQRIASVGYAMMAGTVPDGSITAEKLAPGVGGGGGAIADGSITAAKLAAGAASGNLMADNLSAVAAGGIIGSLDANSAALLAQGFVRDATVIESDGVWQPMPSGDTVAGHTAVWTGTELLIWGGVVPYSSAGITTYMAVNRGLRYNPATGVWTTISTVGAPQARYGHSAVWTGTEMLVWGGQSSGSNGGSNGTVLATGGRYNPATNTWSSMLPNVTPGPMPEMPGTPDPRRGHLAFWTGTEMLVWGGSSSTAELGATMPPVSLPGKRYNLATNTWSSMAATNIELNSPIYYRGVWTGSEMLVFGGTMGGMPGAPPRAGRYSPAADAWQALPAIPGDPTIETGFSAISAGTEMLVWGGTAVAGMNYLNTGYRFDPAGSSGLGSWTAISTMDAPAARSTHHAVWSGTEMVVWGGTATVAVPTPSTVQYNDGGRYNLATDSWQPLSTTDAPAARFEATATFAGDRLVVWAGLQKDPIMPGIASAKYLKQGASYQPATNTWSTLSNGSPAPRFGHTAVWTGTHLIVWGGTVSNTSTIGFDPTFGDGARFNPATGLWTPLPDLNAPVGRFGHSAVWTGTEMIIWGGQRFDTSGGPVTTVTLNSGARFNPLTNTWTPTTLAFPPAARSKHTAVWAGAPVNRMLIWGGSSNGTTDFVSMLSTGGRYDPVFNSWGSATSTTNAPTAIRNQVSVWTGSEMIVHSGATGGAMSVYSARYYPLSNTWLSVATRPAELEGEEYAVSPIVWTGGELLAYFPTSMTNQLGSYSPISDLWQTPSSSNAPFSNDPSSNPMAFWTGSEMIVGGVVTGGGYPGIPISVAGARYSPATDTWIGLETFGAPTGAYGAGAWTGSEMLLWGGTPGDGFMTGTVSDKGHRYRLPQTYYLYRRP